VVVFVLVVNVVRLLLRAERESSVPMRTMMVMLVRPQAVSVFKRAGHRARMPDPERYFECRTTVMPRVLVHDPTDGEQVVAPYAKRSGFVRLVPSRPPPRRGVGREPPCRCRLVSPLCRSHHAVRTVE